MDEGLKLRMVLVGEPPQVTAPATGDAHAASALRERQKKLLLFEVVKSFMLSENVTVIAPLTGSVPSLAG